MKHVRYMEKTRNYYLSQGYKIPYRWAHFEEAPFTPLKKALSESCVTLISTSEVAIKSDPKMMADIEEDQFDGVYSIPSDISVDLLYSEVKSYDEYATHLNDVNSFFPITRLLEAAKSGRIGRVSSRFHGIYKSYSQRKTKEVDAPEILKRCQEDGVDIAILVPL